MVCPIPQGDHKKTAAFVDNRGRKLPVLTDGAAIPTVYSRQSGLQRLWTSDLEWTAR